jgi:DNA-binding transcriptional ArsR family regulator
MARQLPNRPDPTVERTDDASVLYVDDDGTERIVTALSSDSGLATFRLLNRTPMTASEVADELGVTVQNAGYHLDNLAAADLVEVIDRRRTVPDGTRA